MNYLHLNLCVSASVRACKVNVTIWCLSIICGDLLASINYLSHNYYYQQSSPSSFFNMIFSRFAYQTIFSAIWNWTEKISCLTNINIGNNLFLWAPPSFPICFYTVDGSLSLDRLQFNPYSTNLIWTVAVALLLWLSLVRFR